MNEQTDGIWLGDYKIPWDDPDFSRRMLAEHLAQEHDLASRRTEWIDRQVEWIHGELLHGRPARILDLGCGPGLYSHRLAARGHQCRGIDFGPASIDHARRHADGHRCEFVLGDVRDVAFGGPYELAMILYGEMNVFSPGEAASILRKARGSLAPRGRLIVEVQTPEAVESVGRAGPTEQESESGLFSDRPHRCRTESRWLPGARVAVQTFTVTETTGERAQVHRSTTKAWSHGEMARLLGNAGFGHVSRCCGWPCNSDALELWVATGS
ncbi:MAG: class I SAM-dependent methyltransferase [Planctomycetota bacterium]|jgi:SAM-dependent methyltransferase